ncbi:hypothetical protein ODS41_12190 [Pyrobaculum sp. 3827-6]|uniref:hypothetical protein n=1 Tax=Pyrobaculum sp. 3827-6 TaxID=2983604 RepID=UPI0021D7E23D|nr:hypothetical protein [Pyrobaculum sp. 3827-6]MCU7788673.1 hypothetical protein [Pyrobaculum sp. 3827-6]
MIVLRVVGRRAVLMQRGAKLASFSAEGVKWWYELFGGTLELRDDWSNLPQVAKAYVFAKLYPYVEDKYRLVKVLREEIDDFEAVYWKLMIRRKGLIAVSAFKKLYSLR